MAGGTLTVTVQSLLVLMCYLRAQTIRASHHIFYNIARISISLDPLHRMDKALKYKRQHPSESYLKLSNSFGIPASTIRDRHHGTHAPQGHHMRCRLSIVQEGVLIDTINQYDERGTLLNPKHIHQLAQRLSTNKLGQNWTTTFLRRQKDRLLSRFYQTQELARLQADTPETRRAFLSLVSLSSCV